MASPMPESTYAGGGGGGGAGGQLTEYLLCVSPTSPSMSRLVSDISSLGRYVFGSEISYNKAPPRLPGLGC